jgi:hypothetical protein
MSRPETPPPDESSRKDPSVEISTPVVLPGRMFEHQVGGHSPCVVVGLDRVAKTLKSEELDFYVRIPVRAPQVLPFLPHFFGWDSTVLVLHSRVPGTVDVALEDAPNGSESSSLGLTVFGTVADLPEGASSVQMLFQKEKTRGVRFHSILLENLIARPRSHAV